MSVKAGTWIQLEWPELVKGKRQTYKFQCPENHDESPNQDMKLVLLVLDEGEEEEQKYLKKVSEKRHSRVGKRYQVSELPDIGSEAAEFDEIDEEDIG
jgi:hypothetical protein